MGLFDSVSSAIKSIGGSSGGGGSGISDLFNIGATIGSTYLQTKANKDAAKDIKKAEEERNDLIREQNRLAQERYDQYTANAAPATSYLRRIIATEGGGLTPGQQLQLEDTRRASRNQLASSGLRGSGRATTAALRQVEADTLGNFATENRNRAQNAANLLQGQGLSATSQAAQTGVNTAIQQGQGITASGYAQGGSDIANAGLKGQALGDIASIVASDIKDRTRKSKYMDPGMSVPPAI